MDLSQYSKEDVSSFMNLTGEKPSDRWEFLFNVLGTTFDWDYEEGVDIDPYIPSLIIPEDIKLPNAEYIPLNILTVAIAEKFGYPQVDDYESKRNILERVRDTIAEIYSKFTDELLDEMIQHVSSIEK